MTSNELSLPPATTVDAYPEVSWWQRSSFSAQLTPAAVTDGRQLQLPSL